MMDRDALQALVGTGLDEVERLSRELGNPIHGRRRRHVLRDRPRNLRTWPPGVPCPHGADDQAKRHERGHHDSRGVSQLLPHGLPLPAPEQEATERLPPPADAQPIPPAYAEPPEQAVPPTAPPWAGDGGRSRRLVQIDVIVAVVDDHLRRWGGLLLQALHLFAALRADDAFRVNHRPAEFTILRRSLPCLLGKRGGGACPLPAGRLLPYCLAMSFSSLS